jgi:hypothetical protein
MADDKTFGDALRRPLQIPKSELAEEECKDQEMRKRLKATKERKPKG